jgi:hypothetical protein
VQASLAKAKVGDFIETATPLMAGLDPEGHVIVEVLKRCKRGKQVDVKLRLWAYDVPVTTCWVENV